MTWPNHTDINTPKKHATGALVMTEAYWLYGILMLTIALIPFGFYWWTRDLQGATALLWVGLPFFAIGAVGIYEIFFFRRYLFFAMDKKVRVETFSLLTGHSTADFRYHEIGVALERRWVIARPIHRRYFATFTFPGIRVAFFSSPKEEEATAAIHRLMAVFGLQGEGRVRDDRPTPSARGHL
jgi:hypothetical protein